MVESHRIRVYLYLKLADELQGSGVLEGKLGSHVGCVGEARGGRSKRRGIPRVHYNYTVLITCTCAEYISYKLLVRCTIHKHAKDHPRVKSNLWYGLGVLQEGMLIYV